MSEIDTSTARIEWPRIIWAGERMPDEISGYHVFSEHATIARFDGDIEREREFHCYVDVDIFDSEQRYHEHQRAAISAERDAAVARAEKAEARVAEVERLRGQFAAGWKAAIEAASTYLQSAADDWRSTGGELPAKKIEDEIPGVRDLPMPTDAPAALERLIAQARAQGLREAAVIAAHRYAVCEDAYSKGLGAEERHCALEAKHIEDKILARAEEIEKEARNG